MDDSTTPTLSTEISDAVLKSTITSLALRFDEELFALSREELYNQWYFQWHDRAGIAWNIYKFSDQLEMLKRRCRRWEEHHHGNECVVERVRDNYLMPRVEEFMVTLKEKLNG